MAETSAQKKAREAKEQDLRQQIEAEMREKLEKEYAEKLEADKAQAVSDASLTATTASAQAAPATISDDEPVEGSVTVHFVDDGLTALGKIWYRGEQITVAPGSQNWEVLTDKATGMMLFNLSEAQQVTRYGRRFFAAGPWPYGGYDLEDDTLTEKERETLRTIQEKQALRRV